jgi:hypothetical protein
MNLSAGAAKTLLKAVPEKIWVKIEGYALEMEYSMTFGRS